MQDNAGFAAIHKVVGLVAQDLAAVRQGHRGGIRIGQADLAVGEALVAGRERTIRRKLAVLKHIPSSRLSRLILLPDELDQVLVHHLLESRHQGIQVGVAGHLGRIGEHLLAPMRPATSQRSTTYSKNRRKTASPRRCRMRVKLEWSGNGSSRW